MLVMTGRRPAVYIPNYNRGPMLLVCLRALAEQTVDIDVVVVDNGSTDGSTELIHKQFPEVDVVALPSNRGFGPALNEAVRRHPSDVLVFSNNDVRHEPRFIEALLDDLGSEPVSVAGVLLAEDDPGLIDSAGVIVDSTLLSMDYLHGRPVDEASRAAPPLGPTGAAALVPLEVFNRVGGFDERMLAYWEDVDIALRMRARGIACRLAPDARAVHRHSATLGSGSAEKNYLMGWGRGYVVRRYGVLRRPGRAFRALASDAVLCAGQIALDRNARGITGRMRGWRAARNLPRYEFPSDATIELSFVTALRLRTARRRRSVG
jgi:N-acetylglucosaminyl-diphospho-decaprenol L-rhamnosyltransferase